MDATSPPVHVARDDPPPAVEALLRQILERLDRAERAPRAAAPARVATAGTPPTTTPATVMLDVWIDGVPYRLLRSGEGHPAARSAPGVSLSPREREVVRLVAKGLPSKAIADILDMSLWTVATHLRRVFAKLGVGTRAEMVARIMEDGLLDGNRRASFERDLVR